MMSLWNSKWLPDVCIPKERFVISQWWVASLSWSLLCSSLTSFFLHRSPSQIPIRPLARVMTVRDGAPRGPHPAAQVKSLRLCTCYSVQCKKYSVTYSHAVKLSWSPNNCEDWIKNMCKIAFTGLILCFGSNCRLSRLPISLGARQIFAVCCRVSKTTNRFRIMIMKSARISTTVLFVAQYTTRCSYNRFNNVIWTRKWQSQFKFTPHIPSGPKKRYPCFNFARYRFFGPPCRPSRPTVDRYHVESKQTVSEQTNYSLLFIQLKRLVEEPGNCRFCEIEKTWFKVFKVSGCTGWVKIKHLNTKITISV